MMSNPVQQGSGHLAVSEDLWPFPKGQISGDYQGSALIELRYQMKQELPAALENGR